MDMQNELFGRVSQKAVLILYQEKIISKDHFTYISKTLNEKFSKDGYHDAV